MASNLLLLEAQVLLSPQVAQSPALGQSLGGQAARELLLSSRARPAAPVMAAREACRFKSIRKSWLRGMPLPFEGMPLPLEAPLGSVSSNTQLGMSAALPVLQLLGVPQ